MRSGTSQQTGRVVHMASPAQKVWLRTPEGLWSRIEQAFLENLDTPKLRGDASAMGLEPDDLAVPQGTPESLLAVFRKANPGVDLEPPPKDPYQLALGVLRMNLEL